MLTSHQNSIVTKHNDNKKYWSSITSDTKISKNLIYRFLDLIGLPIREKTVTISSSSTSSFTTSSFTTTFLPPLLPSLISSLISPFTSSLTPPLISSLLSRYNYYNRISINNINRSNIEDIVVFFLIKLLSLRL